MHCVSLVYNNCFPVSADSRHAQRSGTQELTPEEVSDLVKKINRKIRNLHLQVSRGPNETDGTIYYALINTADNEMTRSGSRFSQKELIYFRKLMAAIVESENSIISSTKALNIAREEEIKFTITAAEHLLSKWFEQNWFEEPSNGKIAIGIRTILEMNVYLREHFAVHDCYRCKALCIRGSNCLSCDIKLHFHCVDSQFIPNNKCPNCSKQWSDGSNRNGRSSNAPTNSTQSDEDEAEATEVEEEEAEEEEEDEEVIHRERRSKKKRI